MLTYAIKRLLGAVPTLFIIVTVAFFMIRMAPGGPFALERPLPQSIMDNLQAIYHLDEPLVVQYLLYLKNLLAGNLGPSMVYRDFSVAEIIGNGLPVSIQFGGSAILIALGVGALMGSIAALRQNSRTDYSIMGVRHDRHHHPELRHGSGAVAGAGGLSGLAAGRRLGRRGDRRTRFLPIVTLALPQLAVIARLTRGSMIEVLRSNHIRTARAKGSAEWLVLRRHALRARAVAGGELPGARDRRRC